MAPRPGFIIQNALTAGANLDLAEPDALDFNLLGNQRFGVITGCAVLASGSSTVMSVSAGVAVVDGALVNVPGGQQVTLPGTSTYPRFDLVVVGASGVPTGIQGTADANPIFPELTGAVTVLAAVLLRPSVTPQVGDVTDKRLMLTQRFTTAVSSGSVLHNGDPTTLAPLFDIDFNGKMVWDGDGTALERFGTKTLKVSDTLVAVAIQAVSLALSGNLAVGGDIIAQNFRQGAANPTVVGNEAQGDLYKNLTNGTIWIWQGTWVQLSTVPIPAGMTMMGFMSTAPAGWLMVNGQTISKAAAGGLWDAFPTWQLDANSMKLPNADGCWFAQGTPGAKFGNPTTSITIDVTNMPPHKHLGATSGNSSPGGSHNHTVTQTPAGSHAHTTQPNQGAHVHGVSDPGHHHPNPPGAVGYLLKKPPPQPSGWALGNQDSVLELNTGEGPTNISINSTGSVHQHSTDAQGNHTHGFSIDSGGSTHTHPIPESNVGGGAALNITPPTMGMNLFVKT